MNTNNNECKKTGRQNVALADTKSICLDYKILVDMGRHTFDVDFVCL